MARRHCGTNRASRRRAHSGAGVGTTSRTARNLAERIQLDVRGQVRGHGDGGTRGPVVFQRELVGRRVNLAEVVDTGVGLRGGASFHKVRNRDGGQQADDGHNDHDFNQGKTRLADVLIRFHVSVSIRSRRERRSRRVI